MRSFCEDLNAERVGSGPTVINISTANPWRRLTRLTSSEYLPTRACGESYCIFLPRSKAPLTPRSAPSRFMCIMLIFFLPEFSVNQQIHDGSQFRQYRVQRTHGQGENHYNFDSQSIFEMVVLNTGHFYDNRHCSTTFWNCLSLGYRFFFLLWFCTNKQDGRLPRTSHPLFRYFCLNCWERPFYVHGALDMYPLFCFSSACSDEFDSVTVCLCLFPPSCIYCFYGWFYCQSWQKQAELIKWEGK